MRQLIPLIIRLFCVIGCLCQLYHLTAQFVKFKVRNDVAYEYRTTFELPDIDFMLPIISFINITELMIRHPIEMSIVCSQFFKQSSGKYSNGTNCESSLVNFPVAASTSLLPFITIKDVQELTHDPSEKILSFKLSSHYDLIEKKVCKVHRYFMGLALLVRLSCRNGTQPLTLSTNSVSVGVKYFAILKHKLNSLFGIRISDRHVPPQNDITEYAIYESKKHQVSYIRFTKTISRSLEYPYETRCLHYEKTEMLQNCLVEFSLNESEPFLWTDVVAQWNQYPEDLKFIHSNFLSPKVSDLCNSAVERCNRKLMSPECSRTKYSTNVKIYNEGISSSVSFIFLQAPIEPIIYLLTVPILSLPEYLIFVGSILGVWFGFSIFGQLFRSYNRYQTIIKTKRQTINLRLINQVKQQLDLCKHNKTIKSCEKCRPFTVTTKKAWYQPMIHHGY